ncbi:hypothetical protein CCH79_00018573 [Gambusia affinis]|uniref:Methyltransferase domain-containing protein n=1 Tax=Gambusia affinis TaxID=33528 RepID=A0A315VZ22_GAMAF|nr:hypothetical protein CCH79_00018573 [Gambusia affinis]
MDFWTFSSCGLLSEAGTLNWNHLNPSDQPIRNTRASHDSSPNIFTDGFLCRQTETRTNPPNAPEGNTCLLQGLYPRITQTDQHLEVKGFGFIMSNKGRTSQEVRNLLQSCNGFNSEQTRKFYDNEAEMYEQDFVDTLEYRSPHQLIDLLVDNFSGDRGTVQVLDVACGSGLAAKLMFKLGFRNFVGVDCSKRMLEEAAKTKLYQQLQPALLGTDPLPAQTGTFDLVILAGGLGVGFTPVSVIRELCNAAKPGGLICLARGNHTSSAEKQYDADLDLELQVLVDEGLLSRVAVKKVERYMLDPQVEASRQDVDPVYITGTLYLYQKTRSSDGNSQSKEI